MLLILSFNLHKHLYFLRYIISKIVECITLFHTSRYLSLQENSISLSMSCTCFRALNDSKVM